LPASPVAWRRETLAADAGLLALDDEVLAEVERLADDLARNPLPVAALRPDDFTLPACRALMARARDELERGVGFVILDRLSVERLGGDHAAAVYWLLGSMLARPVAQNWAEGKLLYDVRDSGKAFGYGVRPDITNRHQNFHTDNSYNLVPPRYVGLLCLETAEEGGVSGLASLVSAHEELRRASPELLDRLYRPYLFDRQNEHAPGAEKVLSHPLFEFQGGEFRGRLSRGRTLAGYALAGQRLDEAGQAALDALEAVLEDPAFNRDFVFAKGQMQFVHNLRCGHRRTAFRDGPTRRRHLVRLWLRDEGRRFYNG
jgi:alpha-ketoglutarate-dependent taurine dioxygenase